MQKEMKLVKIAQKKKMKESRQKAKKERREINQEKEKMKQYNKESMNYDGEYIEDYGTHFFCSHLPAYYYLKGPCYHKPADGDVLGDSVIKGNENEEGEENCLVVDSDEEAMAVEEECRPTPYPKERPQVRRAAKAHKRAEMQPAYAYPVSLSVTSKPP
jgi:hypothetical protein